MTDQVPVQNNQTGVNAGMATTPQAGAVSSAGRPFVRKSTNHLRTAKRKSTMTYLLEDLQQQLKSIPETFESVDRGLPAPPVPAVLQKAIGNCFTHFLDFSDAARAVQDQRETLLESICCLADENQRQACAASMAAFESRMFSNHSNTAVTQINNSYEHLSRLLRNEPTERSLPWQSRLLAASHFLLHVSKPETLCQGSKIGAQIICLIQKLAIEAPASLAEMIASVGISGAWKTFDGKIVNVDEHSLKPGIEEIMFTPGENQRSYAVKILQILLLNNCLRRRSRPMFYSETPGRPGRDYGGQIVKTIDGELVNPKLGVNLNFVELALLARHQFGMTSCIIVNDESFPSQSPECRDNLSSNSLLIHVSSESDLSEALLQARENNSFPVMIAVSERRLLAETYTDSINHCINVTANNEYGMLKIFNPQLLPGMQRTTRVSLQRLYNASFSVPKAQG